MSDPISPIAAGVGVGIVASDPFTINTRQWWAWISSHWNHAATAPPAGPTGSPGPPPSSGPGTLPGGGGLLSPITDPINSALSGVASVLQSDFAAFETDARKIGIWIAVNWGLVLIAGLGIYLAFREEINETAETAAKAAAA